MNILDILIIVLILAFLGGYSLNAGAGLTQLLLVIALVLIIARLLPRRKD
jgi:uncharacterized membrane protein YtjA (UPF0391 family)